MKENLDTEILKLRSMTSPEAAAWVIDRYPVESSIYGNGISLLAHRSWKKADQRKLAKHFFRKLPFASAKPYEIFASFMSIANLLNAVEQQMPTDNSDIDLLKYHLRPVLIKYAKTEQDRSLAQNFLERLS